MTIHSHTASARHGSHWTVLCGLGDLSLSSTCRGCPKRFTLQVFFPFQQAAVRQGSQLLGLDGLDDLNVCFSTFHFPLLPEAVRWGALWESLPP
jgi:hypothetical protein